MLRASRRSRAMSQTADQNSDHDVRRPGRPKRLRGCVRRRAGGQDVVHQQQSCAGEIQSRRHNECAPLLPSPHAGRRSRLPGGGPRLAEYMGGVSPLQPAGDALGKRLRRGLQLPHPPTPVMGHGNDGIKRLCQQVGQQVREKQIGQQQDDRPTTRRLATQHGLPQQPVVNAPGQHATKGERFVAAAQTTLGGVEMRPHPCGTAQALGTVRDIELRSTRGAQRGPVARHFSTAHDTGRRKQKLPRRTGPPPHRAAKPGPRREFRRRCGRPEGHEHPFSLRLGVVVAPYCNAAGRQFARGRELPPHSPDQSRSRRRGGLRS